MRRVAIAGVLAMDPEVIVLDEPTAGLDPRGQREIMDMFYELHKERDLTTILVTHSMEDAARYADKVAIMHEGRCVLTGTPTELFSDANMLHQYRLEVPRLVAFERKVEQLIGKELPELSLTEEHFAQQFAQLLKGGERT